ncbi:ATP-grasp domain-containing protein [Thiothrix winogradskyi]|uniref:Prokaryotic glutathione synthetase ATP-binding domain-containing protein n=1 Tax=Thiothrix winogradskyi TaxID=96472 RepID=A0ABY3SZK7_9GAMM|nr:hypothetical protein [Thiothrix winogradskyi]UJS24359.1 hypothetical protein L2Y54_20885 [Thiothrix winogradskyi]
MKRCAFLSMASLEKFVCYDELLYAPLQRYGWHAETVDWRDNSIDWNQFDAVIIRSCWDYQSDPAQFLTVLATIERSTAKLDNSLEVVRWNLSKTYLRDLEAKGIPIVPTAWFHGLDIAPLLSLFTHWQTPEIILKPVISACADDTFRLTPTTLTQQSATLIRLFQERDCMVQPFIPTIVTEGEYSLFFFGDEYSHTILKTPKSGDFRVQEEHGGQLQRVEPEAQLLELSRAALAAIPEPTLYARVDWVRTGNGFALMELELIEPSLYFNMDATSAERFARVFATPPNAP